MPLIGRSTKNVLSQEQLSDLDWLILVVIAVKAVIVLCCLRDPCCCYASFQILVTIKMDNDIMRILSSSPLSTKPSALASPEDSVRSKCFELFYNFDSLSISGWSRNCRVKKLSYLFGANMVLSPKMFRFC